MSEPDYVMLATTSAMQVQYQIKVSRVEARIKVLKNKTGGYAQDLNQCLAMYRDILAIIDKYSVTARPAKEAS